MMRSAPSRTFCRFMLPSSFPAQAAVRAFSGLPGGPLHRQGFLLRQPASFSKCRWRTSMTGDRFRQPRQRLCRLPRREWNRGSVAACPVQSVGSCLSPARSVERLRQDLNLCENRRRLWRLSYYFFLSYALLCYAGLSLGCQMVYQWYPFGCQLVYQDWLKYIAYSCFPSTVQVNFETRSVCIGHCVNCC